MDFSDWDIRGVTQVVIACAAVVAALTGVYGVVNAVRSYRSSIASAERQAQNERRDQARFVHPIIVKWVQLQKGLTWHCPAQAFISPNYLEDGPLNPISEQPALVYSEDMLAVTVALSNDSEEVISDVQLWVEPDHALLNLHYPVNDEHDMSSSLALAHADLRYVLPKTAETVLMMVPWGRNHPLPDLADWKAVVQFTDARDNQWVRRSGEPLNDSDSDL